MKKPIIFSMFTFMILLSSCTTTERQTAGIAGGAALGGLVGHTLTGGSTAGTVIGAAVGSVGGYETTK
jgi:osmotically inducible lipoprotein OsmB